MKTHKAVYAASLDPITNGHINVVERVAPLYDELVVLVAVDSRKIYAFTAEERVVMAQSALAHLPNVAVNVCINRYVVKQAESIGAQVVVRGLRNFKDLEDEQTLAEENRKICPRIETIWLPCLPSLSHISSSMVKGHVGVDPDWENQAARSVPSAVVSKLKEKLVLRKAREHWARLMLALGNPKESTVILEDLLVRYREPCRTYHTLEHIVSMLDECMHISTEPSIELAIWFHDAIYDSRSNNNEEQSDQLAQKSLTRLGLVDQFRKTVSSLVLATKHTEPPNTTSAKILTDLDLMIFGKPESVFDQYEAGIRTEYSWVSDGEFRTERIKILVSFLNRPYIYSTEIFREKYENGARKNLRRAVENLESN